MEIIVGFWRYLQICTPLGPSCRKLISLDPDLKIWLKVIKHPLFPLSDWWNFSPEINYIKQFKPKQDRFSTCFKTWRTGSPILGVGSGYKVLRCQGFQDKQKNTRPTGLGVPMELLEIHLVSILWEWLFSLSSFKTNV